MAYLKIIEANKDVRVYELARRVLTIGRAPTNPIQVLDDDISRVHAQIRYENGQYVITDMKSKNGTYLNNVLIKENKLSAGDRIRIGDTKFIFEEEESGGVRDFTEEARIAYPNTRKETIAISVKAKNIMPSPEPDDIQKAYRDQVVLYRLSLLMNSRVTLPEFLEEVSNTIMQRIDPDRLVITVLDRASGKLIPRLAKQKAGVNSFYIDISTAILKAVTEQKKSILISEVSSDQRFKNRQSLSVQKVKSALCVPILLGEQVSGLLYVDNCLSNQQFSESDLRFLTLLSNQVGLILYQYDSLKEGNN